MNALIAGGGTGGHLFPGIALAQELRRREPEARILFVGTVRGIEVRAVPKAGFELALLPVSGLRRTGFAGLVAGLFRLPLAMAKAALLVRRFRPDVAVSCGGYAAGPAVLASRLLGVPCAVLEQNAIPGFTNKVLGRVVQRVFAALPTRGFAERKVRVVGNPVREDFLAVRGQAYEPGDPVRVLVFGGSQGARALNEVMMELVRYWSTAESKMATARPAVAIVHQTGEADLPRVQACYAELAGGTVRVEARAFIDDMAAAYRDADIVVCRAGATTIAELTVCGRPAILVPFPFAVDDHQSANARTLEAEGAAIHLPQTELSPERLGTMLADLAADRERLRAMAAAAREVGHPKAAADIADGLEDLCGARSSKEGERV